MERPLAIVVVEDSEDDMELILHELRNGGVSFDGRWVQTEPDFVRQLDEFQPDVILSDFALPGFDGFAVLQLARERYPEIPFIFVSGKMGEETAVRALKKGATDYLLKGHIRRLALRVPHKFTDSNRIDLFLGEQNGSQCNVLESPEPAQQCLWSGDLFRASIQSPSEAADNNHGDSYAQFFLPPIVSGATSECVKYFVYLR